MPIKYMPFIPEPIEGQAVLGNFNRILRYKGANEVSMTMQRGMPLYEMEKLETVGENADGNMVIRGECVSACAYLKSQGITVDLVYIDPPFASGADYAKKVYIRRNPKVAEAIAKAEQELEIDELKAFEEKMYGDVWDKEKYLNWMYENLMAIKSVMSETASIYVHLDWHIGHYVKILLDEIFGEANFINEITWYYYNKMAPKSACFPRTSDKILLYSKSDDYIFYTQYEAREEAKKQLVRKFVDGKAINARDENGNVMYTESTEKRIDDVWRIAMLQPADKTEPVGYATQKPEALVNRVISASSDAGMVVADFFGGSGTTVSCANKLGRRFIHCDIGINSIQTARDRLKADGAEFDVLEIKDGVQLYRNPVQTMDKIKSLIPGLKNEDSLDSFWEGAITDSKLGTIPVYVPNLMDSTSKLLDVVQMNRIIHQAIPELDSNIKKVIVYYIDITSEEEILKFIKEDDSTTVEIELRDLKSILDDVVIGDYAEFTCKQDELSMLRDYVVSIDKFVSDRVNGKIMEFNQKAFANSSEKKPYNPITISDDGLELIEYISLDCTNSTGEWHSDSEIKIDKLGYVILNGTKTKEFWDGTIRSDNKPLRIKIRNICGDETVWEIKNGYKI
ncbi:MAG: site-specific DNA-methyltransferase [Clostridia bacterium]|nr:site-specific DNA-methyltransferase [Clostridia bacterium]